MNRLAFLMVLVMLGMGACDSAGTSNPEDTAVPTDDALGQDGTGLEDTAVPDDTTKPHGDQTSPDTIPDVIEEDEAGQDVPVPEDLTPPEDLIPPEDVVMDLTEPDEVAEPDEVEPDEVEPDVVCVPDCTGKECGSDGCDGQCGQCLDGQGCDGATFTCVETAGPVAAFLNYIHLPYEDGEAPCCFDFNGDAEIDNAVGGLMQTLVSLMGDVDVNEMLAQSIYSGELAILVEFLNVADWQNSSGITMNAYVGEDADWDYTDNLDPVNGGAFLALPDSFDENGDPLIVFQNMSIDTGTLSGGPSQFFLSLPLLAAPIDVIVDQAMIEGQVSLVGDSKLHIEDGKLGGVIRKTVLVEALNTYVKSTCDCLGLNQELFNGETNKCATGGTPDNCFYGDGCAEIYNYCGMAASIIDLVLDVDVDNDGTNDSISVGVLFTAIPATIAIY